MVSPKGCRVPDGQVVIYCPVDCRVYYCTVDIRQEAWHVCLNLTVILVVLGLLSFKGKRYVQKHQNTVKKFMAINCTCLFCF